MDQQSVIAVSTLFPNCVLTMNYFGIPMYFYFNEDGTYLGLIADDSVLVAEDGSNSITSFWTFDG